MATLVQIKRSSANAIPGSLQAGELAYSYSSNVLFVGTNANTTINIGGQFYTDLIDNASAANGASNFVRRYANGSAQFQQLDILVGPTSNSHVATKEYVDSAVQANVTLASLNDVNIGAPFSDQNNKILIGNSAGYYVGTSVTGNVSLTNTGIFTIGTGQVTNAMLEGSISNDKLNQDSITVTAGAGLTGGGTVSLGNTITLDVRTGDGMANTGDYINVDSTVVRTDRPQTINGSLTFSNTIYFTNDIDVTGNIYLNGNTTYINVATLNVTDPLIYLAANNDFSDLVDIGFMGGKNTAGMYSHTGLVRDATDGTWHLFDGLVDEGHQNNIVDFANTYYALLRANLDSKQLTVTGAGSYANIDTTLAVSGNTTLSSNLTVSKNATVTQNLSVTGDIRSNGNLTVDGYVQVNSGNINNADGNTLIKFTGADVRLPNGALDIYSGEIRNLGITFLQATSQNVEIKGDLTVSGGDIISTAIANVVNVTTTTLNFGGDATTVRIGAGSGNTYINHSLDVSKNVAVSQNLTVTQFSKANSFVSTKTTVQSPSTANFDGERLRLYDFEQAGRPNYAIGVEGSHIWLGVDSSANTEGWKFYGNTSLAARLSANGVLEVANSIITGYFNATTANIGTLTLTNALAVASGGTGRNTLVANGVVYGNVTSSAYDFATGSEGNVLQIKSGVPTFDMLDGGSF